MDQHFTPVAHLGEFGLIDRMRRQLGMPESEDLLEGIGDDAAVYRISEDRCHVITTDALVEGVHFDRSFAPLGHLGRKAIAVNVSDVAAMNARPRYAVVTIGMPRNMSVEMVEALYAGMAQAAQEYDLLIVGGDTTAAPQLTLSVTVIGEARIEDITYRRGANPGDYLVVTGNVGAAYAGLQVLLDQRREMQELKERFEPNVAPYRYVIGRQLTPSARVDAVMALRSAGVKPRAMIDVSDGVASEVHHICAASACGALVWGEAVPVHGETAAVASERVQDIETYTLFGGEDYELLMAIDPEDVTKLDSGLFTVIGQFGEAADDVTVRTADGTVVPLNAAGYAHFMGNTDDEDLTEL